MVLRGGCVMTVFLGQGGDGFYDYVLDDFPSPESLARKVAWLKPLRIIFTDMRTLERFLAELKYSAQMHHSCLASLEFLDGDELVPVCVSEDGFWADVNLIVMEHTNVVVTADNRILVGQ